MRKRIYVSMMSFILAVVFVTVPHVAGSCAECKCTCRKTNCAGACTYSCSTGCGVVEGADAAAACCDGASLPSGCGEEEIF